MVDDVSSRLGDHGIETARFIASNHMDMCRFSGFEDVGYLKVAAALEHLQERLARYFVRSAARSMFDTHILFLALLIYYRRYVRRIGPWPSANSVGFFIV